MRILYVGPLWYGGTCLQRMEAMKDLGYKVVTVDTEPEDVQKKQRRFIYRAMRKIFGDLDLAKANKIILKIINQQHIDILWVDKGVTIKSNTLTKIKEISPKTILVHYNMDNPFGFIRTGWQKFLKSAPFYDIHFVSRNENLDEYKRIGCKNVFRFYNSYDKNLHRPINVTDKVRLKFGGPVGFIGDYERERAEAMLYLAENGITVRVWGPNWNRKFKVSHPNLKIEGKPLWGEEYTKAICSFDINLGFLRKINLDLHTTRSIEIPACGGFMLAERTTEHLELFEEGKEAEFFSTNEELLEKVQYYLKHEDERNNIAQNGHERCLRSGYSNHKRLQAILDYLYKVVTELTG